MRHIRYIITAVSVLICLAANAQVDRKEVRAGNRSFRKGEYAAAEISYRKALLKDSTSLAGNFNLANALYKEKNAEEAGKFLEKIVPDALSPESAADLYYDKGILALEKEDWQNAVDAFKSSLLNRPEDIAAKERYTYAKRKLEEQQNQQNQDNKDNKDNQDDNKNNDNKGDNKDNQDQDKPEDKGGEHKDQDGQNKPDNGGNQPQNGQQRVSPQQAQQMLQAIQAKEKQTQDKVNKEKAEALKSKQKEKNW